MSRDASVPLTIRISFAERHLLAPRIPGTMIGMASALPLFGFFLVASPTPTTRVAAISIR